MEKGLQKHTSSHAYDVDLVSDYLRLKKLVNSNKTVLIDTKKETYLLEIEGFTKDYCRVNNINHKAHFSIEHPIIINSANPLFFQYVGFSLLSWDLNKIEAFLDYQKAKYKGEEPFPLIVEHGSYDFIKRWSKFNNNKRLAEIMKWVNKNRKFTSPTQNKNKTIKLDWIQEKPLLKRLSKELKIKGYTKKPTDFENVFLKNIKTNWCQDPRFLAYLVYRLANDYKAIKAEKKGHFKAASQLFSDFTDKVAKDFTKNYLKDLSYKITSGSPEKYDSYRKKMDYILKEVFNY